MRVIYRKIRHARYLYIKRNVEKVWGAHYTLGARCLSKNTVFYIDSIGMREFMDTQGSQTGSLKRTDVDKTPSDLAVLGPLDQRPHREY